MTQVRGKLLACVAGLVVFGFAVATASADQLLTGSISSATGQKLEGVQIAASGGPGGGSAWRNPCRPARRAAGLAPADCPAIPPPKSSTSSTKKSKPSPKQR